MKWILVWVIMTGTGTATHSQAFGNKDACEEARATLGKATESAYKPSVFAFCVRSGWEGFFE